MIFECKTTENISQNTHRVSFQCDAIELVVDLHRHIFPIQPSENIEFKFDDSLNYAHSVNIISIKDGGVLGSSGGLIFKWTGGTIPEKIKETFTFSIEKNTKHTDPRRSKRLRR